MNRHPHTGPRPSPPLFPLPALLLCAALLSSPTALLAQELALAEPEVTRTLPFPLTISSIMRGPELIGSPPSAVRWTDDSEWVYFRWLPGGQSWNTPPELYRVAADGGEPEKIEEAAADSLAVLFAPGDLSSDRKLRVSSVGGDLYLVDRTRMRVRRLTETAEAEREPRFSSDDEALFFVRENNLFQLDLENLNLRQLTDLRAGPAPRDESEPAGQKKFLQDQQEKLFAHIRRLKEEERRRDTLRAQQEESGLKPVYLERGERVRELDPTRDGAFVAVTVASSAQGAESTTVPQWITESGYTTSLNTRSKVGDAQGATRVGVLEVATGTLTWLDPNAQAEHAEGEGGEGESPGMAQVTFLGWSDSGARGLLFSVASDYKTWWLHSVDPTTGNLTLLDSLHDDAWVGGPCFGGCAGWIPDSDLVYYVSEATGYAHLYTVRGDGSERRALTSGEWEVLSVEIPESNDFFLLHTNEGSPFDQHVYRMAFDGSGKRPLTEGEGSFTAFPSPDGKRLALLHSVSNRPPELYLADAGRAMEAEQITVSPTMEWLSFPWIKPEIIRFQASDGVLVPARIYRPADLGAEPNGAGILFVHGAGYLHNVHRYWSSYYREYMFNHLLAASGYTVLDIDYRGSAGYGRDWRTAVYRHMGGRDLADHVDGARYLVDHEGVDPDRIGLYGGSYGGFITLMGLFTAPDVFTAGAALRAVTDWAHYNHWYTSRILNLPQDDPEAYERSSPIYFAENFRGHLLIAHGMVDTNVHFSDVVRLAQRLIELGKENWEMAVYPVENHGFREPTSWTDEYRRIFELFERTLSAPGCTEAGGLCPLPVGGRRGREAGG